MADDRFEPAAPIAHSPVRSSNVHSMGYDPTSRVLEVEYRDGRCYRFAGVPPEVAESIKRAPSVGAALAQGVRGRYEHQLVSGEPEGGESTPPPPPEPPPRRPDRARTGPKPPPVGAGIDDDEMDAIRRPEERLPSGAVLRGGRPCSACGLPLEPDTDTSRADAGLQRCKNGHVEMSPAVHAGRLEVSPRW